MTPGQSRDGRRGFNAIRILIGAAGVLAIALVMGTWLSLHYEHRSAVDAVLAHAERSAQKLASRTTEVFDRVDQTTRLVRFVGERGESVSLVELEQAGVLSNQLARSVYATDARGHVSDSTSGEVALNVADEDDFKRLRRDPGQGLLIGVPAKNPLTDQWSIPVSRSLHAVDGRFRGIVTASVDPGTLAASFGTTEASDTAVGIVGRDGIYRARSVGGTVSFGERIDIAALERRIVQIRSSRDPAKSPIDGVSRFVVGVDVDRYPFMAVVAVDASTALVPYENARRTILRWAATLAVLIALATVALQTVLGRLESSRIATARSERTFRATLEGSLDAVAVLDAQRDAAGRLGDMIVRDANQRAAALFGITRDAMIGRSLCEMVPTVRSQGFLAHFEAVIATRSARSAEMPAVDPHLAGRWFHHQLVPLDDGIALISRDITDRKAAEKSLAALARFDALTNLPNRRHFEESLHAARNRAERSGHTLALLYIDLDGFKLVNDTYGHEGGDQLLVEVARRLLASVRTTDLVCRLGGDEFTVVLENAGTEEQVLEVCDRIVATLSEPHSIDGNPARATPSVGAVMLAGAESIDDMRRRADEAMYAAKRAGKARHCLISNRIDEAAIA